MTLQESITDYGAGKEAGFSVSEPAMSNAEPEGEYYILDKEKASQGLHNAMRYFGVTEEHFTSPEEMAKALEFAADLIGKYEFYEAIPFSEEKYLLSLAVAQQWQNTQSITERRGLLNFFKLLSLEIVPEGATNISSKIQEMADQDLRKGKLFDIRFNSDFAQSDFLMTLDHAKNLHFSDVLCLVRLFNEARTHFMES